MRVSKQELKYLNHHLKPGIIKFPLFYVTLKVHKSSWTTQLIVAYSGSLLYHLGVWVNLHLQKFATTQNKYIKNPKELKDVIIYLSTLPSGA